jgi:hypothetical protein
MIQIGVGDEDALDLLSGPSQAGDVSQGLFLAEWHPRVNDRQSFRFKDEIRVGLYVWDDVDVIGDLHFSSCVERGLEILVEIVHNLEDEMDEREKLQNRVNTTKDYYI